MKRCMRIAGVAAGLLLPAAGARGNNLQITNVTVSGRDTNTAYVKFDISWENSWRYTNASDSLYFHDAAWVFFKALPDGRSAWEHVTLEGTGTNPTDYVAGSGTPIEMVVPSDRVGMFVRRPGEGAGTTSVQNVKAVWNFASNSLVKTEKVKLQAFGVEMVYVARGSFKVGSGGTGTSEFHQTNAPGPNTTYEIGSEAAITVGTASGNLYYATSSYGGDRAGPVPSGFPKGYAAFYCMKYDVTEGQWVDFFNTLTDAQKSTRDITSNVDGGKNSDGVVSRNTVAWTTGNATTAAGDRACSFLSWADGCAFADWAGLRPVTELEFEKACRGPLAPVADEYAWGNTTISATTAIVNDGTGTDTATGGNCNTEEGSPDGPYRVGIYATNGASRVSAGASYWGIMELSGNVWKRPVTIGHATGRAFTGLHGNGALTAGGDANVTAWPGTDAAGAGSRGGYWGPASRQRSLVSDRYLAAYVYATRTQYHGSRAVRTAP